MGPKTERIELRLDEEMVERLDKWRATHPGLPSRSEAVRVLIDKGMGQAVDQLFQIARQNVLLAARIPGAAEALGPSYIYAWDNGVYPACHNGAHAHEPFSGSFNITREMVDELSEYLDKQWNAKKVPSFYELEDYYEVRYGRTHWDRVSLMRTCRYFFLLRLFDENFWKDLLRGSDHPTEAKSIIRKWDPSEIGIA